MPYAPEWQLFIPDYRAIPASFLVTVRGGGGRGYHILPYEVPLGCCLTMVIRVQLGGGE